MSRPLHAVAALAALVTLGASRPGDNTVSYEVAPVIENGAMTALAVEVRFPADPSGRTVLELPDHGGKENDYWKLLSPLDVQGARTKETSPSERVLFSEPGAPVTVRYRVSSGYDHDPDAKDANPYRPIIRPTWFEVLGERVFVWPKAREKAPATFRFGDLPPAWQAASDLQHSTPQTVDTAQQGLMIGGADVQVIERRTDSGGELRLAYRGRWNFSAEALADEVARVSAAEDGFWGEGGKPFLVTLMPLVPATGVHSSGGRGVSEGFSLYEEPDAKLADFPFLLAHERMHTWIPMGLGGQSNQDEALDHWFTEGFTDFYAARLLLRSGAWSPTDFVAQENEMLTRYWLSPVRNAPNTAIQKGFWTDYGLEQLPYDRGRLFATLLDDRLRRTSGGRLGLDDLMRRQRQAALREDAAKGHPVAAKLFPLIYLQATGRDLGSDLARYVEAGVTVALPADLYGGCARVETQTIPELDPGFDRARSGAAGEVVGVRSDGPAYAAGLRDGMKLLERLGPPELDPRKEVGYRVIDNGTERIIWYRPAGKGSATIQQVELSPNLTPEARTGCVRRIAGGSP